MASFPIELLHLCKAFDWHSLCFGFGRDAGGCRPSGAETAGAGLFDALREAPALQDLNVSYTSVTTMPRPPASHLASLSVCQFASLWVRALVRKEPSPRLTSPASA